MVKILNEEKFQDIVDAFTVNRAELKQIAASFRRDIELGLAGDSFSSLGMLKSYIALPTGEETGEFLALDFGGTNVRVLLIELLGKGEFKVLKKTAKPLCVPGVYDFVSSDAKAEDLFDFISGMVDEVIDEDHNKEFLLGHTFSFPSKQTNIYNAQLIIWTKEFATQGVEGEVVNDLLSAALHRNGITNVRPIAVINDTVATLLAAAYQHDQTYIGSICATGCNTAYLESYVGHSLPRMVLNLEAGGFDKLVTNKYDKIIDQFSEKPGQQRLEKMASGRYLGGLFGLAIADGLGEPNRQYVFTTIDLSTIISDNTQALSVVKTLLADKLGMAVETEDCTWIKALAEMIIIRSARLVASTYVGIIWHLNNGQINPQNIAIDGSLYEKIPMYAEAMKQAFSELLGEDASKVHTFLENRASGVGAAIAAAI